VAATVLLCESANRWEVRRANLLEELSRGSRTCTSDTGVARFEDGPAEIDELLGQADQEGRSW
jgi:hypothetical protein